MPLIEINPVVLLTGAGFTKNYGGYLACEMLTSIRNEAAGQVREWIDEQPSTDFESLYDTALQSEKEHIFAGMNDAVRRAFHLMDENIRSRLHPGMVKTERYPTKVFSHSISNLAGEENKSRAF